ncbi:DUF3376 domain-containing protein [Nocardioides dongxiaopingii]|uniref:DUF3376 domain-containing protein n=1 Tax=Nocardioides sp. S-1144 TaxID=2582905 RepID=UPI001651C952|nr:DUF3376 domain-containing protein [Nocardioides sp. S-1144]
MTTETRFALVLNGGVSLAVWMGGVVHELDRLRLASVGVGPAEPGEQAVHDAWRAILGRTDRRVVVDAVAGTSAGGINGTLLATAVARGAELPHMKAVWGDLAALQRGALLREDKEAAPSVLDGDFFVRSVADVVAGIAPRPGLEPAECTLLVTATALRPQPRRYDLEHGLAAWAVDSRRVYRFRLRHGADGVLEDDDFGPDTVVALAGRASAGLPVAFAPVWEGAALRERRRDRRDDDPQTWLIDGGVLDNAPFEPLLDELRDRSVAAPFERVVLYVTPSTAAAGQPWTSGDAPDVARVVGAVVGAVREPDQRADMETLGESFARASSSRSGPHHVLADLLSPSSVPVLDPVAGRAAAAALFPAYRARRLEEAERWLLALGRPAQLVPPAPLELAGEAWPVVPDGPAFDPTAWSWGLPAAARILRWWGRALVLTAADDATRTQAFRAVDRAQRRVRTLRRAEEEALLAAVAPTSSPSARLAALTAVHDDLGARAEVGVLLADVVEAVGVAWPGAPSAADLAQHSLDLEVVSSALSPESGDRPAFRYRQVTPAAPPLVPVEASGYGDWPARKLHGERWNHFGAFGSREGRAHDWLWGRLDGASALCEYLVGRGFADDPACRALADAILAADGTSPDRLEVGALRAYHQQPGQLLREMVAEDDSLDLLIDTVPEVLGEVRGAGPALEWVLARRVDDTDVPPDAGLAERLKLRLVRVVATPVRLYLDRVVDRATDDDHHPR